MQPPKKKVDVCESDRDESTKMGQPALQKAGPTPNTPYEAMLLSEDTEISVRELLRA